MITDKELWRRRKMYRDCSDLERIHLTDDQLMELDRFSRRQRHSDKMFNSRHLLYESMDWFESGTQLGGSKRPDTSLPTAYEDTIAGLYGIDDADRELLRLRCHGLSCGEIAKLPAYDCTRMTIHRWLSRLRPIIEDQIEIPEDESEDTMAQVVTTCWL